MIFLSAAARLLLRLKTHSCPLKPPQVARVTAPVTQITTALLCDKSGLLYALRADFMALVDTARWGPELPVWPSVRQWCLSFTGEDDLHHHHHHQSCAWLCLLFGGSWLGLSLLTVSADSVGSSEDRTTLLVELGQWTHCSPSVVRSLLGLGCLDVVQPICRASLFLSKGLPPMK